MPKIPTYSKKRRRLPEPEDRFVEGIYFGPPKLAPDDPLQPLFQHVMRRAGLDESDVRVLCIRLAVEKGLGHLVGIKKPTRAELSPELGHKFYGGRRPTPGTRGAHMCIYCLIEDEIRMHGGKITTAAQAYRQVGKRHFLPALKKYLPTEQTQRETFLKNIYQKGQTAVRKISKGATEQQKDRFIQTTASTALLNLDEVFQVLDKNVSRRRKTK